jgi:glycoprotein-N-acetylgalactosamine 3-beta-galactosyltransferase
MVRTAALFIKMRMVRTPFAFLLLAGLSWMSLWTLHLPPENQFSWLSLPERQSTSHLREETVVTDIKPLRRTNLEIVRSATAIDLTYIDVTKNHTEHPHCGARDERGNWGYIHDETALRRSPPPFPTDNLQQDCQVRDSNYIMLTKRVTMDKEAHDNRPFSDGKRAKILCIIYSTDAGHDKKIPAIRESWGQKCDGFMVGSNKTDASVNAVDIPHAGPEIYRNMWQKVRSIWSYVYDYYYEKYDWFHIGGDDMYVLVENLRLYLESDEIKMASNGGETLPVGIQSFQTPLYLGRRFAYDGKMSRIYNSGGPGYTLNKAALKLLVNDGWGAAAERETYAEDLFLAAAFRENGVLAYDTKDDSGAERYMHYPPGLHVDDKLDVKYSWYKKDSIDVQMGLNHSSPKSIAFHYISPDLMRRMHAILYRICDSL